MRRPAQIAVCCLLAVMASGAFAAVPAKGLAPQSSPAVAPSSHTAPAPTPGLMRRCPPGPVVIPLSKGRITQPASDSLKAGKPVTVMISLYDGKVEAAAEAGRQERHLTRDDGAIIEMRVEAYKLLKSQMLSGYGPGEIVVVQDHPSLPELTISIHDFHILQALLGDPKVMGVFAGSIPVCAL